MNDYLPHFQPIIDVSSGKIVGYEALARQRLASGEVVTAGALFSDPSVDREFLLEVDRTVRRKALANIPNIPAGTFLTLNVSPEWIDKLQVGESVPTIEMIEELGVDPKRVIIEITETEGDLESLQRLVSLYRQKGMRIAVDDFGAGYSELGRLVALEPDLIKLDMRFFKSAVEGGIEHDAVRAIGFMAERIGCDVLCEGVETKQEFDFAIDCGVNFIQGFLFYKAQADYVAIDDSKIKVSELRKSFLENKVKKERAHISHYQEILSTVHAIRDHWLENEESSLVDALPKAAEGFIRFYVCREDGEQITPNYEYYSDKWHLDERYLGLNWSGRPYFYQVLAISSAMSRNEVSSRPYRDRASRSLCQTIGIKLDDERILFVDYICESFA